MKVLNGKKPERLGHWIKQLKHWQKEQLKNFRKMDQSKTWQGIRMKKKIGTK